MDQIAKIFQHGRSQAVRLPAQFSFDTKEVFIRRDERTGDVILSRRPSDWEGLFALVDQAHDEAQDFLVDRRQLPPQKRQIC